jgi:hypothetical protein
MNKIIRYFDINSNFKAKMATAKAGSARQLHWIPQWLALFAGIWISPYFEAYRLHGHWEFGDGWGRLLFSAITAVMIFPGVYKKLISEDAPFLVIIAPCFVAGVGYEALLNTALKATT